jgi:hypothetical protein
MTRAALTVAERYRPVGKHRFGLLIVAYFVLYALAIWTLSAWFGIRDVSAAIWLGFSVFMIASSFRSLIDPTRYRRAPFSSRKKLRWLRAGDASSILFFTVFGMLSLQRLLADPVFKTLFVPE